MATNEKYHCTSSWGKNYPIFFLKGKILLQHIKSIENFSILLIQVKLNTLPPAKPRTHHGKDTSICTAKGENAPTEWSEVVLCYHSDFATLSSEDKRWPNSRLTAKASAQLSLESRKQRDRMSPTAGPPKKCKILKILTCDILEAVKMDILHKHLRW